MAEIYSDQYKEVIFQLWYDNNKKIGGKFSNSIPDDENGRKPNYQTIENWRDSYGWIQRAETVDAELSRRLQDEAIDKRIKMYEEHVSVSNSLIEKGKEYLVNHPIDDMADALKAISLGVEIQRVSIGQIEMGRKILGMSNEQLTRELNNLLQPKNQNDEFIDADSIEDVKDD